MAQEGLTISCPEYLSEKDTQKPLNMNIREIHIMELINIQATPVENCGRAYGLIWGQCSDIMREKVEALPDYAKMKNNLYTNFRAIENQT